MEELAKETFENKSPKRVVKLDIPETEPILFAYLGNTPTLSKYGVLVLMMNTANAIFLETNIVLVQGEDGIRDRSSRGRSKFGGFAK